MFLLDILNTSGKRTGWEESEACPAEVGVRLPPSPTTAQCRWNRRRRKHQNTNPNVNKQTAVCISLRTGNKECLRRRPEPAGSGRALPRPWVQHRAVPAGPGPGPGPSAPRLQPVRVLGAVGRMVAGVGVPISLGQVFYLTRRVFCVCLTWAQNWGERGGE